MLKIIARHPDTSAPTHARSVLVASVLLTSLLPASALQTLAQTKPTRGDEVVHLDKVVISDKTEPQLQVLETAAADLSRIAGATSLIPGGETTRSRVATPEDLLALQPGVYAQSAGGTDAIKISIRGSSLNSTPGYFRDGIQFLFDGLSITGPGGTPYELFETWGLHHTSVLRGANAFEFGALTFGGAINFVTNSGVTSPGLSIHLEGGSFGWNKEQLSLGGVRGDLDYYVSITESDREGFQDFSSAETKGFASNFGFKITKNIETRLFIRHRIQYNDNPGTLTRAQLHDDPDQANPANILGGSSSKKDGSTFIGSKTTVNFENDSTLQLGFVYHNYPQILSINSPTNPNYWDWRDLNASIRYTIDNEIAGHSSKTTLSVFGTYTPKSGVKTYEKTIRADGTTPFGPYGHLAKEVTYAGSYDFVVALGNDFAVTKNLWVSSGLGLTKVKRDIHVRVNDRPIAATIPFGNYWKYESWDLAPRFGLRYQLLPDLNVFSNVSRTIDAPSSWKTSGSGVANNYAKPLRNQSGTTVEFGAKGSAGVFQGSLAVYRTWIKNELLSAEVVPAIGAAPAVISESNASPTIHQGIEAGLDTSLLEWAGLTRDKLILRQSFTLNDFYFRSDRRFGSNNLPGIPDHIYQAELQFQHRSGLYVGVNTTSSSSYDVDYNNRYRAPSYVLLGARAGYEPEGSRWKIYIDLKNLTDEHYATTTTPVESSTDATRVFYPGDGFGAFAGVAFRF